MARFHRPFKLTCRCCFCYSPCCLQEMEITASGQVVGYILQKQDCCNPVFQICDANKKAVLEIKGPMCAISCCNDINFDVRAFPLRKFSHEKNLMIFLFEFSGLDKRRRKSWKSVKTMVRAVKRSFHGC